MLFLNMVYLLGQLFIVENTWMRLHFVVMEWKNLLHLSACETFDKRDREVNFGLLQRGKFGSLWKK